MALYTLLGAFGALGCTFLGDRLGRRMTILLANVLQGLGAILQASAFSFGQFIVGRIIIGLGTGGIVATVSVWQSEVSKAETRGEHVAAFGAFAGMGISLALWVAFGMSFTDPNPVAWRFTLASTLFFSILAGLFIIFLPESPRWLATCLSQPSAETARRLLARAADLLLSTIETRLPYSLSRPLTAISVVAVLTHASIKQSRTTGQCDNNV